ncbi:uncharacterized protein A1O9_10292 [Exophiala aquamarina CBS 119918]|uniref:Major facilitator superfamily (MFS) profile domain-containing protein n=1 Tax=Exophiala aquamarina CBS 119918 TaxID=1182545 RepID=A0A072PEB1_9EURO|nr:uncharacterized protein A1O9_10292 [Exophiala aquamarina CBS 119918]KEF53890.1 hypothetical protein A1O9_10292 [Exophiala aquamarina CBS 119918]
MTVKDLEKPQSAQMEVAPNGDSLSSQPEGDYSGAVSKSNAAEIALCRKLDRRILPILWAMYYLNYLDRNAIAQARLNNLEDDLGLVGNQFNVAVSILFVGYLVMQVPSNMIMSKAHFKPSYYMAICMMVWAIVSACTAAVHNYIGLLMVRFFLGITEAPYYPGAMFLLSVFYTRKEIATRLSILYSANILATATSGLIAAATFETLDGVRGLSGWRWLFIIEGAVTFGVALISMFFLPDHPLTTRWLTPEERELAHARIARDTVGLEANKGARAGFMQAVRDPRLWLITFMQNCHLSATGFNSFFPTVVKTLGFSRTMTLVLTCPPYLVSALACVVTGISSGKFNERTWHITGGMVVAMIGFITASCTMNVAGRYTACFLFASGCYAVNAVILGWVTATLGQTSEKKAAALSIVNMFGNASFIYTPYLYPQSDGPKYLIAMSSNTAFSFATIVCAWILRVWLMRTNSKIRKSDATNKVFYAY